MCSYPYSHTGSKHLNVKWSREATCRTKFVGTVSPTSHFGQQKCCTFLYRKENISSWVWVQHYMIKLLKSFIAFPIWCFKPHAESLFYQPMYPSSTLGEVENEPLLNTTVRRSGDGTSHIVVTALIEKIIKSKKL